MLDIGTLSNIIISVIRKGDTLGGKIMDNEELLHTMTFNEVNEIRKGLQDKLEMALLKKQLGN
jgi:hypothetical protein